jgi:hypothetical protein
MKGGKPPWRPQRPILVIGDFCNDRFTQARAARISREQPVPVFVSAGLPVDVGGGAFNVERQALALGVEPVHIVLSCTTKHRFLAGEPPREIFRIDAPWPSREGMPFFWPKRTPPSAIIFVDYQGVPPSKALRDWMRNFACPLIADSHGPVDGWQGFDLVKVSEEDALSACGGPSSFLECLRLSGAHNMAITRGARGHIFLDGALYRQTYRPVNPKHPGPIANVSGAGDVFTATAAVAMGGGLTAQDSTSLGGIAASLRVMKHGYNEVVTWDEIRQHLPDSTAAPTPSAP